jgi:hypothetical protein
VSEQLPVVTTGDYETDMAAMTEALAAARAIEQQQRAENDRLRNLACKACATARIFVTPERHVFILHGNTWWFHAAGTPEAEEHVKRMQASALGGAVQMALASRKKD